MSWCPDCGYGPLDSATPLEKGSKPSPGMLSICIGCGSFLQYDQTMHLVIVTAAEMRELPEDTRAQLHHARRVIHQVNAEKRDKK